MGSAFVEVDYLALDLGRLLLSLFFLDLEAAFFDEPDFGRDLADDFFVDDVFCTFAISLTCATFFYELRDTDLMFCSRNTVVVALVVM